MGTNAFNQIIRTLWSRCGSSAVVGAQRSEQGVPPTPPPPGAQPDCPSHWRLSLQWPQCDGTGNKAPAESALRTADAPTPTAGVSGRRCPRQSSVCSAWPPPLRPSGGVPSSSPSGPRTPVPPARDETPGRQVRPCRLLTSHLQGAAFPCGGPGRWAPPASTSCLPLKPSGEPPPHPRKSDLEAVTSETPHPGVHLRSIGKNSARSAQRAPGLGLPRHRPAEQISTSRVRCPVLGERTRSLSPGEAARWPGMLTGQSGANRHGTFYNLQKPLDPMWSHLSFTTAGQWQMRLHFTH